MKADVVAFDMELPCQGPWGGDQAAHPWLAEAKYEHNGDFVRYDFDDGSRIVVFEDSWDVGVHESRGDDAWRAICQKDPQMANETNDGTWRFYSAGSLNDFLPPRSECLSVPKSISIRHPKDSLERDSEVQSNIERWISITRPHLQEFLRPIYRNNFPIAITLMHIEIGLKRLLLRDGHDENELKKVGHRVHDLFDMATDDVKGVIDDYYSQFLEIAPDISDIGLVWFTRAASLLKECNDRAIALRYDETDEIAKHIQKHDRVLSHAGLIEILWAISRCLLSMDDSCIEWHIHSRSCPLHGAHSKDDRAVERYWELRRRNDIRCVGRRLIITPNHEGANPPIAHIVR